VALAAASSGSVSIADATPPRPQPLSVVGGAGWHSDNAFSLGWEGPVASTPALVATHYRVLDPEGAVLREASLSWVGDGAGPLLVPKVPGIYGAEVWFEDAGGAQGPAASTQLRFDDKQPGSVETGPVPGWIGRAAFPVGIHLDHPAGPPPLSGIRGYAAATDRDPGGSPCVDPLRCSEAETTLRGGPGDDELKIANLPDGTSYLHVVAVSGAGVKSAATGQAVLHVDTTDPVTHLAGAPGGWTNRTVELTASASDSGSGMAPQGAGPAPFTAIRVDDGAPAIGAGDRATTRVIAEGAHRVSYYARDAAGNADDGAAGNGAAAHQPQTAWVRIDRTSPAVAFSNSQDPTDPDLIRAKIADPLSGPDTSRGWIGVRRAGSDDAFARLPSAPRANGELRARWRSDAEPIGEYEFEAIGFDAAGNSTVTTRRADREPMVLSNPLKATTALRAAFQRRGTDRVVPYGRRVGIHGRLIAGLSRGLNDTPVRIVERFDPGADPVVRVWTVRTGPTGAFSIHAPPGPSRTIELAFEGTPTLARSSGRTLRLGVRNRLRLRTSAGAAKIGGKPLVFRGRVAAPPGTIPRTGMPVQLQFRLGGAPWSEFRTVQTDAGGRFRYAYRFTDDDSRGVRFQFRAYVSAQENWPYEPAGSRPVLVRGR
jgi:hypothetical protein